MKCRSKDRIKELNMSIPIASALYKGCRILFSPIRKADFLILGINPGAGTSENEKELEPTPDVEYIVAYEEENDTHWILKQEKFLKLQI